MLVLCGAGAVAGKQLHYRAPVVVTSDCEYNGAQPLHNKLKVASVCVAYVCINIAAVGTANGTHWHRTLC